MKKDIIIGIDPDIDKNGVATLVCRLKRLTTAQMKFGALLHYIQDRWQYAQSNGNSFVVIVEGGWLNHSNWHVDALYHTKSSTLSMQSKIRLAAKMGVSQGQNHQRGLDIVEFCQHEHIPCEVVKPYPLSWGKDHRSKITKEELDYVVGCKMPRNNQEERDAALIAWLGANLPIRYNRNAQDGLKLNKQRTNKDA